MPERRVAGAAVALDGYLYVVGGTGGNRDLLRYDPAADEWARLAPLIESREHTAAVAVPVVAGGAVVAALELTVRGAGHQLHVIQSAVVVAARTLSRELIADQRRAGQERLVIVKSPSVIPRQTGSPTWAEHLGRRPFPADGKRGWSGRRAT